MATEPRPLLSDDLLQQVEEIARAQNRNSEDVVSEAVRKYLGEQSWIRFVEKNEARARTMGIGEEDVDRLISELHSEKAAVRPVVLRVTADTNILVSGLNFRRG